MAEVRLANVSKIYPGGVKAVDAVDLEIRDREFVVLVGPSGCGKSTTLRMVAGLEDISAGEIRIGERVVNSVPPKDRDIAMVFQNYALYPHMSVYKNMAFGLMLRRKYGGLSGWFNPTAARAERQEIDRRVRQAARLLAIENLLERQPRALSGGQRQRVAVGRAIVRNPKAYLFDEPLSNLDAKLRIEMRGEIKRLHRQVQTTTIYVTHDQEEAMTLGDRVVVMKDGRIQQVDTPYNIYENPVNRFVAGFVGTPPMNFLPGRITRDGRPLGAAGPNHGGGLAAGYDGGGAAAGRNGDDTLWFDDGEQRLAVAPRHAAALRAHVDQRVVLGIRPELLHLAQGDTPPAQRLAVQVAVVEPLGDRMDVLTSTARHARIVSRMDARTRVAENAPASFRVELERVHYFAADEWGARLA